MAGTRQHRGPRRRADMGAASAPFTTASHEIGCFAMRFKSRKFVERESLRIFQGRLAAAGGRRLRARTGTLVAAAAVAGLALLGPRITAANTGVCSVGEPSTFTRCVGRSGVSSVIAARAR